MQENAIFFCVIQFLYLTLGQKNAMIYGYIRVSSDKQTVENQRFEIQNFCNTKGVHIDDWIEETISGTKNYTKRQLGHLLQNANKGDTIICSELSRLGRNLYMIMEILSICMSKECFVWTIKDGYRLGDDIQSKVLAFAFGLSAEIERNLISQRTKEALARLKAEGKAIGHPKGTHNNPNYLRLHRHDAYIRRALQLGTKQADIIRHLNTNRSTLQRYIKQHIITSMQNDKKNDYP